MLKYYPSSSGFIDELGQVYTKYDSGCLRSILASQGLTKTIPKFYKTLGDADEENFEKVIQSLNLKYQREKPIKRQLSETVQYSGRIDFEVETENGIVIVEKKATVSTSVRLQCIRKSNYRSGNLAQLVSYLLHTELSFGTLRYDFYQQKEDGTLVSTEHRTYEVEIKEDGRIFVDGLPSPFSAEDQVRHMVVATEALDKNEVKQRPKDWMEHWTSPCRFCKFSGTCDKYDEGSISDEDFVTLAQDEYELRTRIEPEREIKIQKYKQKKKEK